MLKLVYMFRQFDNWFQGFLRKWGITVLRVSLGVIFLWFGYLKIAGVSPVKELVESSFASLPFEFPFTALGVLEMLIGIGLTFKLFLRLTLLALWLMLLGTFSSLILNPDLFFNGKIYLLTTEGEFVMKNLVLIASGMVIGGFQTKPLK